MAAIRHEARGSAREPDGGNAETPGIGQQDSLHSKYCCFVEYRSDKLERQIVIKYRDRFRRSRVFRSGFERFDETD